nr:Ribosomal protein S10 [Ipomoea trifida]
MLLPVSSSAQVAYGFTKALPISQFQSFTSKLATQDLHTPVYEDLNLKRARPRGIKRSLPVLTWISGDGIRRPEATSSRGRSLALGGRLAVSLTTAKRLPSAA